MTNALFMSIGFILGVLVALFFVARDKNLVSVNPEDTIIKRKDLEKLIKVYSFAAKKIDPDLADEFKD